MRVHAGENELLHLTYGSFHKKTSQTTSWNILIIQKKIQGTRDARVTRIFYTPSARDARLAFHTLFGTRKLLVSLYTASFSSNMGIYMSYGWWEEIPASKNAATEQEAEATILRYICHALQLPEVPEFHRKSLIDRVKWHLFHVENAVLKFEGMHVYYLTSSLTGSQLIQTAAPTPVVSSPVQILFPTCPEQLSVLWRAAAARNLSLETLAWRMMAGIDDTVYHGFRTTTGVEAELIQFVHYSNTNFYKTKKIKSNDAVYRILDYKLGDRDEVICVGFKELN